MSDNATDGETARFTLIVIEATAPEGLAGTSCAGRLLKGTRRVLRPEVGELLEGVR